MTIRQIVTTIISILGIFLSFQPWYTLAANGYIVSGFEVEGWYTSLFFIMVLILTLISVKGRSANLLTLVLGVTIALVSAYRIFSIWGQAQIHLALWLIPVLGLAIAVLAFWQKQEQGG